MNVDSLLRGRGTCKAPFATLAIATDGRAVTSVRYLPPTVEPVAPTDEVAAHALREVDRYLDDPSYRFTVALAPAGTAFHRRVWQAIAAIPAGAVRTYGAIARDLGIDARAVGQACGANPIPLFVPCHRVVGSRGALGGFMNSEDGDPLAIKRWLLVHEGYRFGA